MVPKTVRCPGNPRRVAVFKQRSRKLPAFQIPPANYIPVHKNCGADNTRKIKDITHILPGQKQAFCFLITQHKLVKACKEQGLSTAVETCGYADPEIIRAALPYVDLFLWDIKDTDSARHKRYTGVSNGKILKNLLFLLHNPIF